MKKGLWIAMGVVLVIVLFVSQLVGYRNELVRLEEQVNTAWAQVQNQYQRRYDLIPNLVETVKGFATQEREVLTQVTEARARAGGVMNVSSDILNDPQKFAQFQQVQDQLGSALQRLLVVVERYPELKSNQNFLTLQAQLEGTENRIAVERRRFNEAVQAYNSYLRRFPQNLAASLFGFKPKAYFQAGAEAQQAPKVKF
ncbi:MAG: LemA family protein [Calditrichaeota bacterium]|nr:MAG: LemA family protein [Calditrichota bacterium]